MASRGGFPKLLLDSIGITLYSLVFLLSTLGNSFVLYVCYMTIKRRAYSLKWFIANLAIADLTFALLSTLDIISYFWGWVGGQVTCKLQSFFIEACYTVSVTTLTLISFERHKAVVKPFSAIISPPEGVYRKLVASWIVSLVVASPLLYAYQIQVDNTGEVLCTNISIGDLGRQVYYSIHAVCFFLVPLIYMIYAQSTIFRTLRSNVFPMQNAFTTASSKRHLKAAKPLVALTVAFTTCWSPFIFVRALIYFHLTVSFYIWKASQILILLNTALDPMLYGMYGETLKPFFKRFFQRANFRIIREKRRTRRIKIEVSEV